jgi:hypothetical protein
VIGAAGAALGRDDPHAGAAVVGHRVNVLAWLPGSGRRSSARPHDAAWWSAGQLLVGFSIFGGERFTIRAGRATHDVPLMVARIPGGFVPWPIVGHGAFDGEEALVMVGEDEEERLGRSSDMGDSIPY